MATPTFRDRMNLLDQVLAHIHGQDRDAVPAPEAPPEPQTDDEILGRLGLLPAVPIPGPQVATAPALPQAPAVPAPAYSGAAAQPTADAAAGNPAGGLPGAALWVSDFPQGIYVSRAQTPTQAGVPLIGGGGYTVPALGSVLVQGTVAAGGAATGLQLSTDGGQTFADLAGGYAVQPGQSFTFGQVVAQGDIVNVATASASALSRLVVAYIPGLAVDQTTATNVTVTGDVTAQISGPVTIETASGTPIDATISGTVSIAANQVVQVENTSGGSVTVSATGTVDVGTVNTITAGSITVDNTASGPVVNQPVNGSPTYSGEVTLTTSQQLVVPSGGVVQKLVVCPYNAGTTATPAGMSILVTNGTGTSNIIAWIPAGGIDGVVYAAGTPVVIDLSPGIANSGIYAAVFNPGTATAGVSILAVL